MRLSLRNQKIIRETVKEVFGEDAGVIVFGSRVNDFARGGDVDLLIRSNKLIQQRERKALNLVAKLQLRLGDQPIDVLVIDPLVSWQAIHEEALRTGVEL